MRKKRSALRNSALLLAVFVAGLVNLASANPYSQARDSGVAAPPTGTEPPTISIFSPVNYLIYDSTNVSLTFKVNVGKSPNSSGMGIYSIYYRGDWLQKDIYVNSFGLSQRDSEFLHSLTLTGVPAGNHTVTVYATEIGRYYPDYFHYYRFYLTGSSSANFVVSAAANPSNVSESETPLDTVTNSPVISILSPENRTAFNKTDILIDFRATVGKSIASAQTISEIFYKTDWEVNNTWIYRHVYDGNIQSGAGFFEPLTELSTTIRLKDVPNGNRNLTIYAIEARQYDGYTDYANNLHYKIFEINGSSSVIFAIDVKPPKITVLSPENKTYMTSAVPLNFVIVEGWSKIVYNLDGKERVTIAGNVTLTGLSEGEHSLEIYAVDLAGNKGYTNTVFFTVEPFPTMPAAAATVSLVAVFAVAFHFARAGRKT